MNKEIMSSVVFAAFVLTAGTAWYFAWVRPNTERMYSIMDCMTEIGDHTEYGYSVCVDRLNESG